MKAKYIKPSILVQQIHSEGLLAASPSIGMVAGSAIGGQEGGDALCKGLTNFDDDTQPYCSIWE